MLDARRCMVVALRICCPLRRRLPPCLQPLLFLVSLRLDFRPYGLVAGGKQRLPQLISLEVRSTARGNRLRFKPDLRMRPHREIECGVCNGAAWQHGEIRGRDQNEILSVGRSGGEIRVRSSVWGDQGARSERRSSVVVSRADGICESLACGLACGSHKSTNAHPPRHTRMHMHHMHMHTHQGTMAHPPRHMTRGKCHDVCVGGREAGVTRRGMRAEVGMP